MDKRLRPEPTARCPNRLPTARQLTDRTVRVVRAAGPCSGSTPPMRPWLRRSRRVRTSLRRCHKAARTVRARTAPPARAVGRATDRRPPRRLPRREPTATRIDGEPRHQMRRRSSVGEVVNIDHVAVRGEAGPTPSTSWPPPTQPDGCVTSGRAYRRAGRRYARPHAPDPMTFCAVSGRIGDSANPSSNPARAGADHHLRCPTPGPQHASIWDAGP